MIINYSTNKIVIKRKKMHKMFKYILSIHTICIKYKQVPMILYEILSSTTTFIPET